MEENCFLPVNLGNPNEISMNQLVLEIQKMIPDLKIKYMSLPQDDPRQRKPDIERAKTLLKWEPSISLNEGLLETIEYFKNEIKDNPVK